VQKAWIFLPEFPGFQIGGLSPHPYLCGLKNGPS
jgi:hypothetical protein